MVEQNEQNAVVCSSENMQRDVARINAEQNVKIGVGRDEPWHVYL